MNSIIELYKQIYNKVEGINAQIESKKSEQNRLLEEGNAHFSARIENLEAALEKADDYLLRVKGFQELAKKNLESTNVLTIEAPPGYRVNLNRLRNWSMLIDPTASNDPYAQRVYVVAKCDECFLEKKKKEFTEKINLLRSADESSADEELCRLEREISTLCDELKDFELSDEFTSFSNLVVSENEKYWITSSPSEYPTKDTRNDGFAPGGILLPLPFPEGSKERLKSLFGKFYDMDSHRVVLPYQLSFDRDFVMTVACSPSRSKQLDKGIQNIVLNYVENTDVGSTDVYVIDAARYSSSVLGNLRSLENTSVIKQVPRNPEQLTNTLEGIVSKFSDIDDIIDLSDSVREYNKDTNEQKLSTTLLVLYGWPNSFSNKDKELVRRIMLNYERYGLSLIAVSYSLNEDVDKLPSTLPEYAANNAINIVMRARQTTIYESEKEPRNFVWYTFNEELSTTFIDDVRKIKIEDGKKGNEYTTWFSCEQKDLPVYTREYKPIDLPFGMDAKEHIHNLSFENENFAAYLVGASRSGKSTLLHTLIAGIIRNYHPDNVELWLADFKQLEFKRYMTHLPPHVKYVLLDESTELVFDLIDKLTLEMLERQKLFSRIGKQRIDQVDLTKLEAPLPVIFVILDEFSIMSQSIAESPSYKLKLQNLLAKGAALGIKFLFSSQTFTTGVAGLTPTARAQIQQRISMKGAREEISETLELSANLKTEQVTNWMDALPPHYALVKYRIGPDTPPQVKRFLVMYFADYSVRDTMIDAINSTMNKSEEYLPNDISTYKDKHPVLVDGNSFDAFDELEFKDYVANLKKKQSNDFCGDEMFVSFGTPRLMTKTKFSALSNETRENILLISRSAEQQCAASILLSAMKSFKLQGGEVEIWAYSKNRLYKTYKQVFLNNEIPVIEDIDDICKAIASLKENLINRQISNKMIVLIGIERICMDFDFVDGNEQKNDSAKSNSKIVSMQKEFLKNGAVVATDEDEAKRAYAQAWVSRRIKLKREAKAAGKSENEIKSILAEAEIEFRKEYGMGTVATEKSETKEASVVNNAETDSPKKSTAYNAKDDFVYVMKQGSRIGYHFVVHLNDLADVKQCQLKLDYFRYKMAFQVSIDDSRNLFNNKLASTLPEHICQYDDTLERYSFRPYLHQGIGWDGWSVDGEGKVISPYTENVD